MYNVLILFNIYLNKNLSILINMFMYILIYYFNMCQCLINIYYAYINIFYNIMYIDFFRSEYGKVVDEI